MERDVYRTPLVSRFATREMCENFSELKKFKTWRLLWLNLAEAERELGLSINEEQIREMDANLDAINFDAAEEYERKLRHDVMAHLRAFGDQCPQAAPIMHLGATSCYVTDNADLIIMRDGLRMLARSLANVVDSLADFAERYCDLPTVGFTHFQPAQLTTVGKRATLWAQDFAMDLHSVQSLIEELPFRGIKGATGTQESFLRLFEGDHEKVRELDRLVTRAAGFQESLPVTGQTYTRKIDSWVLRVLAGVGESAHKFSNDIRLLMHRREVEEPFGGKQVGSSAMPYKRNPMRSERITGLSRFLINNAQNASFTAACQWLERTLDDSSNRRLSIPEAFLSADAVLNLALDVSRGLHVNEKVIARQVADALPFMASEMALMEAVKAGGDRQKLHEKLRDHAMESWRLVNEEGASCDLMERVAGDPAFAAVKDRLSELSRAEDFVGRAPQQVLEFIELVVAPIRRRYANELGMKGDVKV